MENFTPMSTLSQVMAKLAKEKGIQREFRMDENGKMSLQDTDHTYQPKDLVVLKTYRFEGASDPDDNAILYVIQDQYQNKGIIIDAYGVDSNYSGDTFDTFIRDIPVDEQDEYNFDH